MTESMLMNIADRADMIVNGYAFTRDMDRYRILNLNRPDSAAVIRGDGEVLETSMDDIELRIALDYYDANLRFLEDANAKVL